MTNKITFRILAQKVLLNKQFKETSGLGDSMKYEKPAILGGTPIFSHKIPIAFPEFHNTSKITQNIKTTLKKGNLSNFGPLSRKAEFLIKKKIGSNFCISFSSGTMALVAALLSIRKNGNNTIICPSFTFVATAAAIKLAGFKIAFADIDPKTLNIDPKSVQRLLQSNSRIAAVLGVHVFGNPCDVNALTKLCENHNKILLFDAAHAFGAKLDRHKIGNFGICEIFSTSSTKILVSGEGGFITTNNPDLANKLQIISNYGLSNNVPAFLGLNGKLSELHAAMLVETLLEVDKVTHKRKLIARYYKQKLAKLDGISFSKTQNNSLPVYKDFPIIINEKRFGLNRDQLITALNYENIEVRSYFSPPLHVTKPYKSSLIDPEGLPNTEHISNRILCLPIYSKLNINKISRIVLAIRRIWNHAEEIKNK